MNLSKNEVEILEVMWTANRPLFSTEIVELSVNKSWKTSSIHILLNRLLDKEAIRAVGFAKTGKGYGRTFEPTESAQQYYTDVLAQAASRTNLSFLFSTLLSELPLSQTDIKDLEELIKQKKEELK